MQPIPKQLTDQYDINTIYDMINGKYKDEKIKCSICEEERSKYQLSTKKICNQCREIFLNNPEVFKKKINELRKLKKL